MGWSSRHCYLDNGSAVLHAQGWEITGKGFDQGNPRDGLNSFSAFLFLKFLEIQPKVY